MKCKYCEGQCICHVGNPPCSHCEKHLMCDMCGEIFCQDLEDIDNPAVCSECMEKKEEEI